MREDSLVHRLDAEGEKLPLPEHFTFPFRYVPAAVTRHAAGLVLDHIARTPELEAALSEGKMLGVLVVRDRNGYPGFLAGFSGLAGGKSIIPYFVPPILDLTDPHGYFRQEEASISILNGEIETAERSPSLKKASEALENIQRQNLLEISAWKTRMAESKARRDAIRRTCTDRTELDALVKESQFEKAQLRRLAAACRSRQEEAQANLDCIKQRISRMKKLRQQKSEALQEWIFRSMTVENALGEKKSIKEIFSEKGLVPPGGTGECAAPKMLHYAYTHGLEPVAMGEFWYGGSCAETRLHGRFYPSCTGKCGPLLGFMLEGLDVEDCGINQLHVPEISIIFEDNDIIVAEKPSGMLSTPGREAESSLQEILERKYGSPVYAVHRLDMDTSGVIIFARNPAAQKNLQRQFENREVEKAYIAILDETGHKPKGTISLPLSPDYLDRPRQKVDFRYGKEAVTEYEILDTGPGWTRVLFHPLTGRTHQLRIHSAHTLGLGAPIKGDRLYGGPGPSERMLYLHASRIKLRHPATGCHIEFVSEPPF